LLLSGCIKTLIIELKNKNHFSSKGSKTEICQKLNKNSKRVIKKHE
jgi:hypothetical protein